MAQGGSHKRTVSVATAATSSPNLACCTATARPTTSSIGSWFSPSPRAGSGGNSSPPE